MTFDHADGDLDVFDIAANFVDGSANVPQIIENQGFVFSHHAILAVITGLVPVIPLSEAMRP